MMLRIEPRALCMLGKCSTPNCVIGPDIDTWRNHVILWLILLRRSGSTSPRREMSFGTCEVSRRF